MNENIDLTKILEGLEGTELYLTTCGVVTLKKVYTNGFIYPIEVEDPKGHTYELSSEGKIDKYQGGECLLFPSKEQRDWSKFERPIKEGTPVMVSCNKKKWSLVFYKCFGAGMHRVHLRDGESVYDYEYVIPFTQFDPNDIEGSIKNYNIQK